MSLRSVHKIKKGQTAVYVLLLLIVAGAMIGIRFMSRHSARIQSFSNGRADTVRAAVVYGPGSYRVLSAEDGTDSIVGVNYHLLKTLGDSLGVVVQLYPVIDRDDALAKVQTGQLDILASLPADNYIRENFLTSDEVALDRMVLIQKKTPEGLLPATSALALARDTVHVEKGSAAVRRIRNLSREIGDTVYVAEETGMSEEYLAMKVATGGWRYAVVNERIADDMHRSYPDLDYSTPVSFTQFQVWILAHGRDSLLSRVNRFLSAVKEQREK